MVMLMTTFVTLADLAAKTGLDVLSHLERELAIPVTAGLQAQGDLIVIPAGMITGVTVFARYGAANLPDHLRERARWLDVPAGGIELLRSGAGGNPHTLVADQGTCRWTTGIFDRAELAIGVLEASGVAYLIHPEH